MNKVVLPLALIACLFSPFAVASAAYNIGTLTLTGVFPRIFTPNSDGFNDKAAFHFDNPEQLPITGTIYDISGALVADLTPGQDPTTLMLWDGKDSSGRVVPGGIYLYKIEFQGNQFTGTVIVAR
jgi:gliding motility-associated-like protein